MFQCEVLSVLIKGEMWVQGEFSSDSMQMYSDSFKEALKQTMLSQEVMFRKQVLGMRISSSVVIFFVFKSWYLSEFMISDDAPYL